MERKNHWDQGSLGQWIFNTFDNSPMGELSEKVNIDLISFSAADTPVNLGIRKYNNQVYAGNYVGICRLKDTAGNNILSSDGKEVILKIEPRFSVSVMDMLNLIKDDDEFERYLAPQTIRMSSEDKDVEDLDKNELFHFFDRESPIYITDNIAKDSSLLTATVFVSMLKDLCRRPLMGKMISTEQNLTGKVKGKILFEKNIRKNSVKGRDDRLYCRYLRYSEDIMENQVLKAALQKAGQFLNRYFRNTVSRENSYKEMTAFCQNALDHVSLIKISQRDIKALKVTGCYAYYKPVLSVAKMVLNEITLESNGNSKVTGYIIPYAVSMSRLFEMYVRTYLKKSGIHSYSDTTDGIRLLKYDYKTKVFEHTGLNSANYIGGVMKPDLIIENTVNKKTVVFDVKYKDLTNRRMARGDRLQILAYSLMYDCDDVGIFFPADEGDTSYYYEKNEIASTEDRERYYHQFETGVSGSWDFLVHSLDNSSQDSIYSYFENILK